MVALRRRPVGRLLGAVEREAVGEALAPLWASSLLLPSSGLGSSQASTGRSQMQLKLAI